MAELSTRREGAEIPGIQECLAKILRSPIFSQSERQQRFLRFVVNETLSGCVDRLKGYTIGVEVFDRASDFDPTVDAIVRVQAILLRAKLREYYEREGRHDPIRFELPKGGYAVRFVSLDRPAPQWGPTQLESTNPIEVAPAVTPRVEGKPALAVLPFTNLSPHGEYGYFADGVTDNLITEISKLQGLLVISRQSSFLYRNVSKRAEEIARELGVKYLLEGSVQRSGDCIRINVQLVEAASGTYCWAEKYDSRLSDLFAVQDDVTRRVGAALKVRIKRTKDSCPGHEGTVSAEAHDALLQGLERFWTFTPEGTLEAYQHFTHAVHLDPDYAAGHAWRARTLLFRWIMMWEPDSEAVDRAHAGACRAVDIDPQMPFAHAVLGWTALWRKQGDEAIDAGRRAVGLDPNNADAHLFLSFSLTAAGRPSEGLHYIEMGRRLNPYPSAVYQLSLGLCHLALKEYEQAIGALKRGTEINDVFMPNHVWLCILYTQLGRDDEASVERDKVLALSGGRKPPTRSMELWLDEDLRCQTHRLLQLAGLE
ncbi:MAG: hypothetical protein HYR49_08400 [Gammaproteobacteria bacterium]|nr:hypothetical protein [Gammaproteobacteria bacterium]